MKYTLLELVQTILSDMDSDEVNSITDTVESEQVAVIVRDSFFDIISTRDWAHLRRLCKFDSSTDLNRPTHLKFETGAKEFDFINYNNVKKDETRLRYERLEYKYPDEFLMIQNRLNTDEPNVTIVTDFSGIQFPVRNDVKPRYYTSFDDDWIILDSYNMEVDSTVQSSKVQAQAYFMPSWEHVDEFIPDLPQEAVTLLLEESKSAAFATLKQTANQKAEQRANRQTKWLSRKNRKVGQGIRYPNYGRGSRKYGRSVYIDKDN